MLTCIEHEQALKGDTVRLSRQWLIAQELREQTIAAWAAEHSASHSSLFTRHSSLDISLRNVGPEALRLIETYGLVPYMQERTEVTNSNVTERKLQLLAEQARTEQELEQGMHDILPDFCVAYPEALLPRRASHSSLVTPHSSLAQSAFYFLSMRYTAAQFAESIMYDKTYRFYCSTDDEPYNTQVVLRDPDNRRHYTYYNITREEMYRRVVASLRAHHAVYMEYGEDHRSGHAMAIVGLKGSLLVCQNSYGHKWGNQGRCCISRQTFMDKVCNVGLIQIQ